MGSFTRQQLEHWLGTIDVKADRVYDVGGNQKSIKNRVKSWDVKEYKVLDLPDYDFNKCMTDKFIENVIQADVIFCIEVSEYLWNPVRAMKNLKNLLNKDGILYMSFHFIYAIHAPVGTDYLRYTPDGVKKLLNESGFELVDMKYRYSAGDGDYDRQFQKEGMHLLSGVDNNVIGCLVKCRKK